MLSLKIRVGEACTAAIPRRVAMKLEAMEIASSRTQDGATHKWVEDDSYGIATPDFIDHG
jgi:hypothetical protein